MIPTTTVLTVLVLFALLVPGVVGSGFAAPIPEYFQDEWVGFVCLTAFPPGSPATTVLVQFNFDKTTFGGIPLSRADSLYTFLRSNLGLLSPVIGSNPQTTCTLTPGQVVIQFPGADAKQATQQVSGSFQQLGFARYIVVDTYSALAILSSGTVVVLKTDVFVVNGNNDLSYVASNEIAASLVP